MKHYGAYMAPVSTTTRLKMFDPESTTPIVSAWRRGGSHHLLTALHVDNDRSAASMEGMRSIATIRDDCGARVLNILFAKVGHQKGD